MTKQLLSRLGGAILCSCLIVSQANAQPRKRPQGRSTGQRSLNTGLTRTKLEYKRISDMLDESLREGVKVSDNILQELGRLLKDFHKLQGTNLADRSDGPKEWDEDSNTLEKSKEAIGQLQKSFKAGYGVGQKLNNQQIWEAFGALAEAFANLYKGPGSRTFKTTADAANLLSKVYELYTVTQEQQTLFELQEQLAEAISHVRSNDPAYRVEWDRILQAVHGNSQLAHKVFEDSLARNGLQKSQVIRAAVNHASAINPKAGSLVTDGVSIVDPLDSITALESMPGINPDFIESRKRCKQLDSTWQGFISLEAWRCIRYPDGSYIPAFGPSRNVRNLPRTDGPSKASSAAGRNGVPTSIAEGRWEILPGSYLTHWLDSEPLAKQKVDGDAGWKTGIVRLIGPGHYQTLSGFEGQYIVDLYGTDTKAAGERNVVLEDSNVSRREQSIRTEIWLAEGKLHIYEVDKIVSLPKDPKFSKRVDNYESYCTAAYRGRAPAETDKWKDWH